MKVLAKYVFLSLAAMFIAGSAFAQTIAPAVKTFEKNELKFEYPADWVLTDRSAASSQHLQLSKPGSVGLITIISPNKPVASRLEYFATRSTVFNSYISSMKLNLAGSLGESPDEEVSCFDFNGRNISGIRITGAFKYSSASGEIYSFMLGKRLLTLIYMRAYREKRQLDAVWQSVIRSLSLNGSGRDAVGDAAGWPEAVPTGELNGKAIKLVVPLVAPTVYGGGLTPCQAIAVVTVDETGKVIEAKVEQFMNLTLKNLVIAAAKRSTFEPTVVCGKAVRISGYIVYEFKF